jgi:hypothetical protein
MKAVRFHSTGGPEVLVYEDVPDPTPADGEVLIRIEAVGLNFADVMRRRGDDYPDPKMSKPFSAKARCMAAPQPEEGPAINTRRDRCVMFAPVCRSVYHLRPDATRQCRECKPVGVII